MRCSHVFVARSDSVGRLTVDALTGKRRGAHDEESWNLIGYPASRLSTPAVVNQARTGNSSRRQSRTTELSQDRSGLCLQRAGSAHCVVDRSQNHRMKH